MPPQHDLYLDYLDDDARQMYRAAPAQADLAAEIRLMRAVLCHLAGDLPGSHRAMTAVLSVLVRAAALQLKREDGGSEVERALLDAAALVLSDETDDG